MLESPRSYKSLNTIIFSQGGGHGLDTEVEITYKSVSNDEDESLEGSQIIKVEKINNMLDEAHLKNNPSNQNSISRSLSNESVEIISNASESHEFSQNSSDLSQKIVKESKIESNSVIESKSESIHNEATTALRKVHCIIEIYERQASYTTIKCFDKLKYCFSKGTKLIKPFLILSKLEYDACPGNKIQLEYLLSKFQNRRKELILKILDRTVKPLFELRNHTAISLYQFSFYLQNYPKNSTKLLNLDSEALINKVIECSKISTTSVLSKRRSLSFTGIDQIFELSYKLFVVNLSKDSDYIKKFTVSSLEKEFLQLEFEEAIQDTIV